MRQILLVNHESEMHSDLCTLLQKNNYENIILDEVETGSEALRKIVNETYDLLILNLEIPNTDMLSLISKMRMLNPVLPILIYSKELEYVFIKRYLTSGVNGYYFFKKEQPEEILKAICAIGTGRWYISPEMVDLIVEQALYSKKANRLDTLTDREFAIFTHLVKDRAAAKIAEILGVHVTTVAMYKARIYDKLCIRDHSDLKNLVKIPVLA